MLTCCKAFGVAPCLNPHTHLEECMAQKMR
jgi:hypothetical protein